MHHTQDREPMAFPTYLPRYDYSGYMALEAGKTPDDARPPLTRVLCNGTLYEVRTDPAATYIAKAPPWRPVPEGKKVYTARAIRKAITPGCRGPRCRSSWRSSTSSTRRRRQRPT